MDAKNAMYSMKAYFVLVTLDKKNKNLINPIGMENH